MYSRTLTDRKAASSASSRALSSGVISCTVSVLYSSFFLFVFSQFITVMS
jgi:hypothetical protein